MLGVRAGSVVTEKYRKIGFVLLPTKVGVFLHGVYEVLCDLFRDSQTDNIVSTDYKFYSCTAVYVYCCNLGLGNRDRCSFSN